MKRRRIRTSADLLEWFPAVANDPAWESFATEFDKQSSIQHRANAARSCQPKQEREVSELHEYCRRILDAEKLIGLPEIGDDGKETYSTAEEMIRDQIVAAKLLAENVELLLSDTAEGTALRRTLIIKPFRRKPPNLPKDVRALLIFQALIAFVSRTERLPLKRELNVEAHRIFKAKTVCADRRIFGESTLEDGSSSSHKSGPYFAYRCGENFAYGEFGELHTWTECQIVPFGEWNLPHWQASSFSEIIRESGMSGLRDDHSSKGKKGIGTQSCAGTKKVRKL